MRRRIALLLACLIASAALVIFLVPARASALTAAGPHKGGGIGALPNEGVQLVQRRGGGFRGGGFRGGGFRGPAFRGSAFRGPAFRRGFRGGRAFAFRGGPRFGWRGRRVWRRPGWGFAAGAAALGTAPYFYSGYRCPLVPRTVWVRRCY
jgi:hypothetical protein